jgi:transcriptional regulator with XRE-family HTH domain
MNRNRDEKIIKDFGKNLKNIRKTKKLSTRALGDLADVDFSLINRIELGKVNPTLTTILVLADALKVDPAELIHFNTA